MAVHRIPWGDFPDVIPHTQVTALATHVDFAAATSGDMPAARRLVASVYRPRVGAWRVDYVAAVLSYDLLGRFNALPLAFGERVALETQAQLVPTIVQDNRPLTDSPSGIDQLTYQPSFSGSVPKGSYVIVDDVLKFGSSLANLRGHIAVHGGSVSFASSLATSLFAATLAPDPHLIQDLKKRFRHELEQIPASVGFPVDCLTSREAYFCLGLRNLDALRNPAAPIHRVIGP